MLDHTGTSEHRLGVLHGATFIQSTSMFVVGLINGLLGLVDLVFFDYVRIVFSLRFHILRLKPAPVDVYFLLFMDLIWQGLPWLANDVDADLPYINFFWIRWQRHVYIFFRFIVNVIM